MSLELWHPPVFLWSRSGIWMAFGASLWFSSRETTAKFKGNREHFGEWENVIKHPVQKTSSLMERQISLRAVLLHNKRKMQLSAGHALKWVSE